MILAAFTHSWRHLKNVVNFPSVDGIGPLGQVVHLFIHPQGITHLFLLSDIFTSLIQVRLSVLVSLPVRLAEIVSPSHRKLIFLVGSILWLILPCFLCRMYKLEPQVWNCATLKPWYNNQRSLAGVFDIICGETIIW
ncbi:unnamed protein product [Somion occarium]|uniref:Uncharacterized protein n=1 Tax=Somion occarium TaxID=3059160 RepID=A0ABP1DWM3_9APHY